MWTPHQWLSIMNGDHIDSPAGRCLKLLAALEETRGINLSQHHQVAKFLDNLQSCRLPLFLCRVKMLASLKSCGRQWVRHQSSTTACSNAARASPPHFKTGMPWAPEPLLFFSNLIEICTAPNWMSAYNSWRVWIRASALIASCFTGIYLSYRELNSPAIKLISKIADLSAIFGQNSGSFLGCCTNCFFNTLVHAMEVTSVCTALNAWTEKNTVALQRCVEESLHATFCGGYTQCGMTGVIRTNAGSSFALYFKCWLNQVSTVAKPVRLLSWLGPKPMTALSVTAVLNIDQAFSWSFGAGEVESRWL